MTQKVASLEETLNEKIQENIELSKLISESVKKEVFAEATEGMVMTHVTRLKKLSESVPFHSAEDYKSKLLTLMESFNLKETPPTNTVGVLTEQTEVSEQQVELTGPMAAYVSALKKTSRTQ
jgi:hypothetical protein